MAKPTYGGVKGQTTWTSTATSKTISSFAVTAGRRYVVGATTSGSETTLTIADSGGNSWTLHGSVATAAHCGTRVWSMVAASTTSITVTVTRGGSGSKYFGAVCVEVYDSDGLETVPTPVTGTDQSISGAASQDNTLWFVMGGDWNAVDGASRTWRTNAGTATEVAYDRDASEYTIYAVVHEDASTASTDAMGVSAPTGRKDAWVALGIKGTAGGGGGKPWYYYHQAG